MAQGARSAGRVTALASLARLAIPKDAAIDAAIRGPATRAARVHSLLRKYAWNPTSFQILDHDYRLWFSGDAVVAYVDTGRALVVAGAPICSPAAFAEVTGRFIAAAARRGRAVAFFGVHDRFLSRTGLPAIPIGEVMFWEPAAWATVLGQVSSLREQLRRARAKGVRVEQASGLEPLLPWLRAVRAQWLAGRGMAELSFLAKLAPMNDGLWQERRLFVAWRELRPVGYLCLSPIYARRGFLVQELVRDDEAPNGTAELLLDAAFRWAAREGIAYLTLGLAPLAGQVPLWLRAAQACGRPLFDFEGLRAFKAKFRPQGSEVAALAGRGLSTTSLMIESLRVFAGGSLSKFGFQTLRKLCGGASLDRPAEVS